MNTLDVEFVAEAAVLLERAARKIDLATSKYPTFSTFLLRDAYDLRCTARHLRERAGAIRAARPVKTKAVRR